MPSLRSVALVVLLALFTCAAHFLRQQKAFLTLAASRNPKTNRLYPRRHISPKHLPRCSGMELTYCGRFFTLMGHGQGYRITRRMILSSDKSCSSGGKATTGVLSPHSSVYLS